MSLMPVWRSLIAICAFGFSLTMPTRACCPGGSIENPVYYGDMLCCGFRYTGTTEVDRWHIRSFCGGSSACNEHSDDWLAIEYECNYEQVTQGSGNCEVEYPVGEIEFTHVASCPEGCWTQPHGPYDDECFMELCVGFGHP